MDLQASTQLGDAETFRSRKRETRAQMLLSGSRLASPRTPELSRGGGWEESERGRSGGVRVERSPAPRSGPGFACHPLARSAAENSIITAGESGDWERKIRDLATLGSACAPAALHPKHTHIFPPDLESHPKPPQVQVRDSALPPPRPPHAPSSAGLPGRLPASPPVPVQPPTPGAAACSRERASERSREPASQPAWERRLPPNSGRAGGRGHRRLAHGPGAARHPPWPGE
ncbi:transcription factor HES-7-like [Cynocephalus volans]|uniref:transcription factor HES-7-like n=1 Tax=Cynocephalus volans TaxID=110931 RepID=UPI002FC8B02E